MDLYIYEDPTQEGKILQIQRIRILSTVWQIILLFNSIYLKDPVVGIDLTNEPNILLQPSAISSWLASTGLPPA